MQDFNKAIELNPDGSKAYGGRGISKLLVGQKDSGWKDISKADKMDEIDTYNEIKKYCQQ